MKKNLIAKITLGALLCASIIPAAASSHYKTLPLNSSNAILQPHQQVTDMGYRAKNHDDKEVAILAKSMQGTTKVDMRALDANGNSVLDWKSISTYSGWQNCTIHPVDGTVIQKGSPIDMQLRDHYDHKNTSYITDGELDYQ
ncbi:hypothetical protein AXY43_15585 [Clostridium sp. MF28]|uniref:Uncharacterized protein n=1 Tax=Clostridium diolis TaxID=223919 RepID=A0AAV3W6P5_9CLOT|nr:MULTISPECIES: hypothetical protein [Clostridium]AVK49307.1 hypothetical protein AXY43_15585 [Clostridium sp. MF28]OVE66582.1 hypothetical protein CCS79_18065 [Clostridium diolis]PSM56008.1 hypothetical protein C4L39_20060 [Clostridium diolis]QES71547.1 hypothetical protein F3K33_01405 [Clostridium diolis]GEA32649.1 hypothetical protein CDIOL_35720 [Clostridium diolis]